MRGATAIAKILKTEGVEFLSCFPHNEIIDTAAAEEIRPILARTERVAINIADGYSRVTNGRGIGVAAVQDGPGIENAFGAVAQAYGDNTPILLLPGGYERNRLGIAPNFQAAHNFQHITKWVAEVNQAERIPQMMQHVFTLLRSGRGGPVMLEIPTDVMEEDMPDKLLDAYTPSRGSRPAGDPQNVREVVQALLAAKSPLIVAGQGIFYAEAWEALQTLAELLQIPVMTTMNGKSVFPENHPLALGAGGASRPRPVSHFLAKADYVLGVGTSFTRSFYITPIPAGKTMAQITISEQDLSKDYPIASGVIGDAKAVLRQMVTEAKQQLGNITRRENKVASEVAAVKKVFLKEWLPRLTSAETPISPYRVIWELMHTVDRRYTTVSHEAGNPRDQVLPFYESIVPHGYIGWGKTTQLGTSLGLMMGAKLAAPDWLHVNIMGDAAFGMVGMDFETAVRNKLPVLTIIFNNGLLGGYDHYLPISTERYNLRYISGDYAKVAEGLGGYTERVEHPEALKPALERAIAEVKQGRATLLDVITREEAIYPTD